MMMMALLLSLSLWEDEGVVHCGRYFVDSSPPLKLKYLAADPHEVYVDGVDDLGGGSLNVHDIMTS